MPCSSGLVGPDCSARLNETRLVEVEFNGIQCDMRKNAKTGQHDSHFPRPLVRSRNRKMRFSAIPQSLAPMHDPLMVGVCSHFNSQMGHLPHSMGIPASHHVPYSPLGNSMYDGGSLDLGAGHPPYGVGRCSQHTFTRVLTSAERYLTGALSPGGRDTLGESSARWCPRALRG